MLYLYIRCDCSNFKLILLSSGEFCQCRRCINTNQRFCRSGVTSLLLSKGHTTTAITSVEFTFCQLNFLGRTFFFLLYYIWYTGNFPCFSLSKSLPGIFCLPAFISFAFLSREVFWAFGHFIMLTAVFPPAGVDQNMVGFWQNVEYICSAVPKL